MHILKGHSDPVHAHAYYMHVHVLVLTLCAWNKWMAYECTWHMNVECAWHMNVECAWHMKVLCIYFFSLGSEMVHIMYHTLCGLYVIC